MVGTGKKELTNSLGSRDSWRATSFSCLHKLRHFPLTVPLPTLMFQRPADPPTRGRSDVKWLAPPARPHASGSPVPSGRSPVTSRGSNPAPPRRLPRGSPFRSRPTPLWGPTYDHRTEARRTLRGRRRTLLRDVGGAAGRRPPGVRKRVSGRPARAMVRRPERRPAHGEGPSG